MLPISTFYPRVAPFVVGCPDPTLSLAVVDACIDFCEESLAIRQFLADQTCVIGTAGYTLAPTANETTARVLTVKINGDAISPAPLEDGAYASAIANGKPVLFYTTRTDSALKLNLYPPPDKTYTLSVEVALKPLRTAAQVQDDLFNIWVDAIVNGAAAKVQAIPNQSYTDVAGSMLRAKLALTHARKARAEGTVGRVQASRRVQPRAFT